MNVTFRSLTTSDYPQFAAWLGQPHVQKWWREPATVGFVTKEYDGDGGKTKLFVVMAGEVPIGIIQSFWRADYPEDGRHLYLDHAVGIDYFIGEPEYVGKGYGSAMIAAFVTQVKADFPGAAGIVTDPEVANIASIRILEKAGFDKSDIVAGEHGPEQVMLFRF